MKKLALLTFICLLSVNMLFGQAIKTGFLLGPNLSTFAEPQPGGLTQTSSAILGWHAGLFTEFTFGRLSVQPGLFYESIGGTNNYSSASDGGTAGYTTYRVQYLQVPVNLLYNTPDHKFFFGGGPYIAFGLSGTQNTTATCCVIGQGPGYDDQVMPGTDQKFTLINGENPDCGLNFVAGLRVAGGTFFTASYALGLKYLFYSTAYNEDNTMRNSVISITIGHVLF